jgi:hypothetical protein
MQTSINNNAGTNKNAVGVADTIVKSCKLFAFEYSELDRPYWAIRAAAFMSSGNKSLNVDACIIAAATYGAAQLLDISFAIKESINDTLYGGSL